MITGVGGGILPLACPTPNNQNHNERVVVLVVNQLIILFLFSFTYTIIFGLAVIAGYYFTDRWHNRK